MTIFHYNLGDLLLVQVRKLREAIVEEYDTSTSTYPQSFLEILHIGAVLVRN